MTTLLLPPYPRTESPAQLAIRNRVNTLDRIAFLSFCERLRRAVKEDHARYVCAGLAGWTLPEFGRRCP
jgi:hypothetical protein